MRALSDSFFELISPSNRPSKLPSRRIYGTTRGHRNVEVSASTFLTPTRLAVPSVAKVAACRTRRFRMRFDIRETATSHTRGSFSLVRPYARREPNLRAARRRKASSRRSDEAGRPSPAHEKTAALSPRRARRRRRPYRPWLLRVARPFEASRPTPIRP